MVPGTVFSTGSGDISLSAATFIDVSQVSTTGNISATATSGSISDVLTGETDANFIGNVLTLSAGTGVGASGNPIETNVTVLRGTSVTGGIYVNELSDLQIGNSGAGLNTST
jgi:hypothetical protein